MSTSTDRAETATPAGAEGGLWRRITRLELGAAGLAAVVLTGLAVVEPDILGAPLENARTVAFTLGGTAAAAVGLVVMLRLRVPPLVRVLVLGVPFVAVTWWLLSPFFVDDVADDEFSTSIEEAARSTETTLAPSDPTGSPGSTTSVPSAPAEPVLLGAGQFLGLAGHEGSGDAGFFRTPDGASVLRLERFDIENGPDLRLYLVPGADQTEPGDGAVSLGALRGNVGDQTYELPTGLDLGPGAWTVLVWCEAFSVEFVAATVTIT